jgi:hypothetical protein
LEFIVMLLQLVVAMEMFTSLPVGVLRHLYPSGRVSNSPVLLIITNNTAAAKWASSLSWTTENNQKSHCNLCPAAPLNNHWHQCRAHPRDHKHRG